MQSASRACRRRVAGLPSSLCVIHAVTQADRQQYQAFERLQGLLTAAAEELPDVPLYFNPHDLAHTLKTTPPPASVLRSAIVNAGAPWPIP